jgi:uncharacterized delta-60 repeat protein
MKKIYTLIISSCFVTATYTANAQDGSLDLTFGTGGMTTTNFGSSGDRATATAIQSDGKIILVGINGSAGSALARYNSNGTLDNTFGTGGKVTTTIGVNGGSAESVVIQSDNKIVVGGWGANVSGQVFAVVRYNSDGTLDNAFGTGGIVTTVVGTSNDYGIAVALQNDEKIVLAGRTSNSSFNWDVAVVRYNSNGTLDNTFGTAGKVTTAGTGNVDMRTIAIQSDGKIIVGGTSSTNFFLVRFNSNGTLDNTFDLDGKISTDIGTNDDYLSSLVIQSDGKIIGAGNTLNVNTFKQNFALVRYNTDGSLDNTFDTDGKVTTDIGIYGGNGYSVALQSDGKMLVAGDAANASFNNDFAIIRYNTDGSLDNTFDFDGEVITPFGSNVSNGKSIAVQSDGKIVVAGHSNNGTSDYFAVARYNNAGSVGIEGNTNMTDVRIYPNPAKDKITFEISGNDLNMHLRLLLTDVLGKSVKEFFVNSTYTTIQLNEFNSGVYFYQIIGETKILKTGKIIIE